MKFTVLLSLYYKEKPEYLYQCLQSINDNTLSPDQVVIVYDGPIDEKLKEVVRLFANFINIEVVNISENVGLGKALNYGLKYCENDIVLRMDSDDICISERFEKQISFMRENPQVVLLGGAINEFNEDMSSSLNSCA